MSDENPDSAAISHTSAAIVSIGDELVLGQTLDTNSRWLSGRLMDLGIPTVEHATIGDDRAATAATFQRLAMAAPLVIATGGLGPTADDLTREALSDLLGETLVEDASAMAALDTRLRARGRTMTGAQRVQTLRPRSAVCIPNANGTAPGLHVRVPAKADGRGLADLYCLPGPPGELKPMFEGSVAPALRPPAGLVVRTRTITVTGLPEAEAAARVAGLMARDRVPLVGITASGGVLTWRLRYAGTGGAAEAEAALDRDEGVIRAAMGACGFGDGRRSLAADVIHRLSEADRTVGVVESCTGGVLGQMLTEAGGASAAFVGGLLTYSNHLKERLAGVPSDVLWRHGAVSGEVARAMAAGGRAAVGADYALAITGIAGPEGGTAEKPVGTVYVAVATPDGAVQARRLLIPGGRADIRQRAAVSALTLLHFVLAEPDGVVDRRLLWQVDGA